MKKKLLIILTLCVVFCLMLAGLTACSHEHNFNGRRISAKYLSSPATCTEKAKYYYSCDCGKIDVETFEHGAPLDHAYGEFISNGDGTHTKTCANDSTHTITEYCSGGTATCTQQAICVDCGAGYGRLAEHHFGNDGICIGCSMSISITDGIIYEKSADGTYMEVIGYEGTATKVRIADTYNGLPVKTICGSAFYDNYNITTVIIPDSVTSIGDEAFFWCISLTSVTIGDSVTSIGDRAFYYCSSLTSIEIPDSVTSIGYQAFKGCSSLQDITLPFVGATKNGTSNTHFGYIFGASSYSYNDDYVPSSLKTVVITSGSSIGEYAFYNCSSLTSITIGNSVTSIGYQAFYNCSSLTSIEVDINNTTYKSIDGNLYSKEGKTLMQYAIGKTATSFTIPDSVTSIGSYAFSGCSSLTSIEIPDRVTSIGYRAFEYCSSLEAIGIPDGVTSIGSYAFYECSSLTSIEIPDSVTYIANYAFAWCSSLEYIYCQAESQPESWDSYWKYNCSAQVVWGYKGD